MTLNCYKVQVFAQKKALKSTKTGRGPLYFGHLMLPLHFGAYGCDPLLGPGSIAGGHPVVDTLHLTSLSPLSPIPIKF